MIGGRARRKYLLVVVAGLLMASSLGAGSVIAADTRNVYVGDPGGDGTLHLTPASTGNTSAFAVLVSNGGRQTIAHPTLSFSRAVVAFHGPDRSYCDVATGTCLFPKLPSAGSSGSSRQVTVEVAATAVGPLDVTATLRVNERNNSNGANQHVFTASGSTTVFATTDDATASFFAPGLLPVLSTKPGPNRQSAGVSIPDTNGHSIAIIEGNEPAEFCAGAGVACFGQATNLTINFGAAIHPYAEVTLFWAKTALPYGFNPKYAGVAHLLDDGTVVTIPNNLKKFKCTASRPTDCVVSSSFNKYSGFTMTVRIPENGYVKGYR